MKEESLYFQTLEISLMHYLFEMASPQYGQLRQFVWVLFPQLGQAWVAGLFPFQPPDPVCVRPNKMTPNTGRANKLTGISHMKIMPIQPNVPKPQLPIISGPIIPQPP